MREIIAEVHPDAKVSLSHEVYPRWREYDRMSTTLADAFLKTLVEDYLEQPRRRPARAAAWTRTSSIMKSNGASRTIGRPRRKPIDLLCLGPGRRRAERASTSGA